MYITQRAVIEVNRPKPGIGGVEVGVSAESSWALLTLPGISVNSPMLCCIASEGWHIEQSIDSLIPLPTVEMA